MKAFDIDKQVERDFALASIHSWKEVLATEPQRIYEPFTIREVDALNAYQRRDGMHEFTCPHDHAGDRTLVATYAGWICCNCDYRQNWAHAFMAEPIA